MYKETEKHRLANFHSAALGGFGFGEDQHIYSSSRGKISAVLLKNYFLDGRDFWEIYCLEGNLFEGVERFDTIEEVEQRASIYLKISNSKRMLRLQGRQSEKAQPRLGESEER